MVSCMLWVKTGSDRLPCGMGLVESLSFSLDKALLRSDMVGSIKPQQEFGKRTEVFCAIQSLADIKIRSVANVVVVG